MKRTFLAAALSLLLLAGCSAPSVGEAGVNRQFTLTDTVCAITVFGGGEEDISAAQTEAEYWADLLSGGDSPFEEANQIAGSCSATALTPELYDLLDRCLTASERTGGAFDVTLAPVLSAWGIPEGAYRVPTESELTAALALTGPGAVELNYFSTSVNLTGPGKGLDLGGAAPGFIGERMAVLLSERGIPSALLSVGEHVTALGVKEDGSPWQTALRNPDSPEGLLGAFSLTDESAATCRGGDSFEVGGKSYHSVLDPATGLPAETGLRSATVVAADGVTADALSTALYVMGEQKALDFWRASGDFEALLITEDGRVLVTGGLKDRFTFWGGDQGYQQIAVSR